jgi:hypothetical protein
MRDEETLEEEEEKGGFRCGSRLLMWWFIFFNEVGGRAGMRWLQSARGDSKRAAGPFFRSRTRFSFAFSRVSLFIISRQKEKKGGTSGPLMSDSTRPTKHKADMTGGEITPWNDSEQRESVE